jgi:hypothetical protein
MQTGQTNRTDKQDRQTGQKNRTDKQDRQTGQTNRTDKQDRQTGIPPSFFILFAHCIEFTFKN